MSCTHSSDPYCSENKPALIFLKFLVSQCRRLQVAHMFPSKEIRSETDFLTKNNLLLSTDFFCNLLHDCRQESRVALDARMNRP